MGIDKVFNQKKQKKFLSKSKSVFKSIKLTKKTNFP